MKPMEIEQKSFEIITKELGERRFASGTAEIVKRVIHCTADFDYAENLVFSEGVVQILRNAFAQGCDIVTDTKMAQAGINKKVLARLGGQVHCFISDEDVERESKEKGVTRAQVAMQKAAALKKPCVFAIGNAPTALFSLLDLARKGYRPVAVIGVPVGFVNVIESKQRLLESDLPHIVAVGRKGGSNVAAAICNAVLYQIAR